MKVRVHWNLHLGGYTVTPLPKRVGRYTRVDRVCVKDAQFVVSEKGRDYCRTETAKSGKSKRWVHAWVEGELCECHSDSAGTDVSYNPFINQGFVERGTQRLLASASHVDMQTIVSKGKKKPITHAKEAR